MMKYGHECMKEDECLCVYYLTRLVECVVRAANW